MRQPEADRPEIQDLAADLRRLAWAVMHGAVKKNPDQPSWQELHVAVAGGGSNLPALRDALIRDEEPHPWVKRRIQHPLTSAESWSVVGSSARAPADHELPELVCIAGAASSPDEDQQYSEKEVHTVIPEYDDPLRELGRELRRKWL